MASRITLRSVAVLCLLVASLVVGLVVGIPRAVLIPFELLAIASMLLVDRRVIPSLDRRIRGFQAEEKVGAILDQLASEGWSTIHDASTGRGNIDHIAIGPGGVFAIETKSHRGRISSSRLNERWLAQAYAERKTLEELVGVKVDCLLVFSNAYLIGKPISRQRGVLVLPARMLGGVLAKRRGVFDAEQVDALHARVVSALDRASPRSA